MKIVFIASTGGAVLNKLLEHNSVRQKTLCVISDRDCDAIEKAKKHNVPVKILNVLGAGDAFASGFIYGLIQKWSIEKSIKMGNACGSHVVTKEGCANFMPTLEEALKIMNE